MFFDPKPEMHKIKCKDFERKSLGFLAPVICAKSEKCKNNNFYEMWYDEGYCDGIFIRQKDNG